MIIVLCGVRGSGKDTIGDILVRDHGFRKEAFANPLKEMVKHAFPAFTDEDLYGTSKNRERQYEQYPFSGECLRCGGQCATAASLPNLDGLLPPHDRYWWCSGCDISYPRHVSPRVALQALGTEWGRRLYKNVWIDACFKRMDQHRQIIKEQRLPILYGSRKDIPVPELPDFVVTDGRFRNETRRSQELGGITIQLTRGLKESTDPHPSEAELRTMKPEEFDLVFNNALLTLEELPREVGYLLKRLKEAKRHGGTVP